MKKLLGALVGIGLVAGSFAAATPASADVPTPTSSSSTYASPTQLAAPSVPAGWAIDPTGCGIRTATIDTPANTDEYTWQVSQTPPFYALGSQPIIYTLTAIANSAYTFVDNLGLTHQSVVVDTHTVTQSHPTCDQLGTNRPNKVAKMTATPGTPESGTLLQWVPAAENGSPVTNYLITAKVEPNGNTFKTFTTSWSVSGAIDSTFVSAKPRAKYLFTIVAQSASGDSRPLTNVTAYTNYDPAIKSNAPSKVSAVAVGTKSAFLKWSDPVANGSYWGPWDWEIKVFKGKKLVKTHWTDSYSWDTSELARHTTFKYEVRGRHGIFTTRWSVKHSFKTK